MTDTAPTLVADLVGRTAVDVDGDKIGKISDVYLDNETSDPEWLAVNTGLFGAKVSFVPISGAEVVDDDVRLPYAKDLVKEAPRADADGELSATEEDALYAHYGRQATTTAQGTPARDTTGDTGHDTSGPETDEAMTRSEEELDVSTNRQQTGVARLRKWVETENVTMTVPIQREKARMVTEPITESNRDAALSGGDLTSEEHEVVLSEEVVDVQKTVVPKERVRLEKDVETDEVAVDEEVRKERIQMDDERS